MAGKRVTAVDVAQAVGVSRSTVSFVLNNTPGQTISTSVRTKVLAEAARLGYMPHPHARALASGQSHIVLIPLPEWPVEYVLRQLLDEASTVLDDAGYSLVTMDPHRSGHATPLWDTLRPDVVMPIEPLDKEQRDAIRRARLRLIPPDTSESPEFTIGPDLQTKHLLDRGHTSIAYASTTVHGMQAMNADRLTHTRSVTTEAGAQFHHGSVTHENARATIRAWREHGVTGVVAFNDDTAAHLIGAALREGIDVPGEIAVVGHDDSPIASMMVPSISSIRFDLTGLGRHFAQRAIAATKEDTEPALQPPGVHARLIHRESS